MIYIPMCKNQSYFMMTLVMLVPSQPSNNIDVYFQPSIEELKDLWMGILEISDASKSKTVRMHVALLWTITYFPVYAILL